MIRAGVFASILVLGPLASMLALVPAVAADNSDSVGVADQTTGIWYLRSPNGPTTSFYFGNPGDFPIMGDWDCDDVDTPGLYRQSDGYVYLRNSNTQGDANIRFFFGNPGDIPLAGDFNADGCDTVSVYRPSQQRIFVINELGSNDGGLGAADFDFYFGNPGDKPFTADFDGNGQDTVGLHRESTGFVYFRNTLTTGIADNDFFYGDPGDQIVTGRWAQNPTPGPDTVGIFRPSSASKGTFYLRFQNSQGNADVNFQYGNSYMTAVAGNFGLGAGLPDPFDTPPFTTDTLGNSASRDSGGFLPRPSQGYTQLIVWLGTNRTPGSLILDFAVPFTDGPGDDFAIRTSSEWGELADTARFDFYLAGALVGSSTAQLKPAVIQAFDLPGVGIVADRIVITNTTPDPPGINSLADMAFVAAGVAYLP